MQVIRKAKREEAGVLTEISFASKRYWRYPDNSLDVWREEPRTIMDVRYGRSPIALLAKTSVSAVTGISAQPASWSEEGRRL